MADLDTDIVGLLRGLPPALMTGLAIPGFVQKMLKTEPGDSNVLAGCDSAPPEAEAALGSDEPVAGVESSMSVEELLEQIAQLKRLEKTARLMRTSKEKIVKILKARASGTSSGGAGSGSPGGERRRHVSSPPSAPSSARQALQPSSSPPHGSVPLPPYPAVNDAGTGYRSAARSGALLPSALFTVGETGSTATPYGQPPPPLPPFDWSPLTDGGPLSLPSSASSQGVLLSATGGMVPHNSRVSLSMAVGPVPASDGLFGMTPLGSGIAATSGRSMNSDCTVPHLTATGGMMAQDTSCAPIFGMYGLTPAAVSGTPLFAGDTLPVLSSGMTVGYGAVGMSSSAGGLGLMSGVAPVGMSFSLSHVLPHAGAVDSAIRVPTLLPAPVGVGAMYARGRSGSPSSDDLASVSFTGAPGLVAPVQALQQGPTHSLVVGSSSMLDSAAGPGVGASSGIGALFGVSPLTVTPSASASMPLVSPMIGDASLGGVQLLRPSDDESRLPVFAMLKTSAAQQ